jgi:hypothetical protein
VVVVSRKADDLVAWTDLGIERLDTTSIVTTSFMRGSIWDACQRTLDAAGQFS